jgi:hypothetical protein
MGGVQGYWLFAYERNLIKMIGCGFVFGNSLPFKMNWDRVVTTSNSCTS